MEDIEHGTSEEGFIIARDNLLDSLPPDKDVVASYSKEVLAKELREKECLIAAFLVANPDTPIDEIRLHVEPHETGTIFSVSHDSGSGGYGALRDDIPIPSEAPEPEPPHDDSLDLGISTEWIECYRRRVGGELQLWDGKEPHPETLHPREWMSEIGGPSEPHGKLRIALMDDDSYVLQRETLGTWLELFRHENLATVQICREAIDRTYKAPGNIIRKVVEG